MSGGSLDPREADGAAVGRLAALFASLYERPPDARRLLRDAELDVIADEINDVTAVEVQWYRAFLLAREFSKVRRILDRALAEHRTNPIPALVQAAADESLFGPGERMAATAAVLEVAPREHVNLRRLELGEKRELVDRIKDVASMRTILEQTLALGSGSQVLLLGESGVGKTRLAEEAMRLADALGMAVLRGQCLDSQSEAHHPIRDAIARYREGLPIAELLRAVDLPDQMPVLESFLGRRPQDRAMGGEGSEDVNAAISQLLVAIARQVGVCLVVEDLTDADRDTLSFLEYLGDAGKQSRVVTLVTVKDDLVKPDLRDRIRKWTTRDRVIQEVRPLSPDDTAALITLLRNGEAPSPEWASEVYAQTGGNPFFVEQLLRLVTETPGVAVDIPRGVSAVVERRLELLEDTELVEFLQAAAVALDLTHDLELVADVAEIDMRAAEERLDAAVRLRFLVDDAHGEVRFGQSLVRGVIYDRIGKRACSRLNVRAAEWLEARRLFASASHHYERAERPEDMIRTALLGAAEAERARAYRTAAQLYQRALAAKPDDDIRLKLAKVHLILGEWAEAEEALNRLPGDLGSARVLRSQLSFVRNDFEDALRELRRALQAPEIDRTEALLGLANIHLYLGRLAESRDLGRQALESAADATARSWCHAVIGTSLYHMGDIDGADKEYLAEINALPAEVEQRDRFAYTVALHNLGLGHEARGEWEHAIKRHAEALALRTEVSAAREIGHSMHSLVRCRIGLKDLDAARALLAETRTAATALGDRLELAKLDHTEGRLLLATGDAASAVRRIRGAVDTFRDLDVCYDVAHGSLSLAEAYAADGAPRLAVEEAASARTLMHTGSFGLLARAFLAAYWYRDRIEAGLLAYVAGDAVGLPWERMPAEQVDAGRLPSLHATDVWPAGATSDDTAMTLLVAEQLVASSSSDALGFLGRLAEAEPSLKGLGPSTTATIDEFRRTGQLPTGDGNTNGALMRSLPIGWAVPIEEVEGRRAWTAELSRATHPGREAVVAACIGSALAAWALEGAPSSLLLDIAREEASAAVRSEGADIRIEQMLAAIEAGTWQPDAGIGDMDPYETVARVVWAITREWSMADAILGAVRLGGDTDTVAALVGGLLGCQRSPAAVRAELPWLDQVDVPPAERIVGAAKGLAELRVRPSGG